VEELSEDKIRGCLYGAAVGDALALPYGGLSSVFAGALGKEALEAFKPHRSGAFPVGQSSSLVQLMLAVGQAIGEHGGELTSDVLGGYLFPLARDRALVCAPGDLIAALEAWVRGRSAPPRADAEAPIHLLPLALLEGETEEDLTRKLLAAVKPTGHDRAEALALGATFLSVVRYCLAADEVVLGDLLDAARAAAARFSASVSEEVNRIPDFLCLAERDGMGPLRERIPQNSVFEVIAGMVSFLKSPYSGERSLLIALRSGGGCAAGFVCGALAGAFGGEGKIPRRLRETLALKREIESRVAVFLRRRGSVKG